MTKTKRIKFWLDDEELALIDKKSKERRTVSLGVSKKNDKRSRGDPCDRH